MTVLSGVGRCSPMFRMTFDVTAAGDFVSFE